MEGKAKDSEGKVLAIGDQVIVRGRIIAIPIAPSTDLPALLEIEWDSNAPMIKFVKSTSVTKEE